MTEVAPLRPTDGEAADALVAAHPHGLLYQTSRHRAFLRDVTAATESSLGAWRDGRLVGILPVLHRDGPHGVVANSLPFYGSHGGILATDARAETALLSAYGDLLEELDAAAANVSSCPFGDGPDYPATYRDGRIGLMTPLPPADRLEEDLLPRVESRTRRAVRRARKAGVQVHRDAGALPLLRRLHEDNMAAMGGNAKPPAFYDAWARNLHAGTDWDLYVATAPDAEGPVACLLIGHHARVAEYYMPAVQHEHRGLQPGALLIVEAMRDAARRGMTWWNWGGTWPSQTGVYQFKKQWATVETRYANHCLVRDAGVLDATPATLAGDYPGFFVVPYDRLRGGPRA